MVYLGKGGWIYEGKFHSGYYLAAQKNIFAYSIKINYLSEVMWYD